MEENKEISTKAKVVLAAMELLNASNEKNKVTSYAILDTIINNEDICEHSLTKDINEEEMTEIIIDSNIRSINTLVASLVRKGIAGKTPSSSVTVEGTTRNLRQYFIK